jgi:hypothetical protein
MFTLAHFIYGIIMVGIGIITLKFNYQIVGFTGRQDWIESKLGGGSTYLAYKLFALLLVVFGLLLATGLIDPVLNGLLGPLRTAFGG